MQFILNFILFPFFQCNFKIDILENEEVNMDAITAEVIGPSGPLYLDLNVDRAGARASFLTEELGMHEVLVKNEGEAVAGTPHFLRVMPKSKKDYDGKECDKHWSLSVSPKIFIINYDTLLPLLENAV